MSQFTEDVNKYLIGYKQGDNSQFTPLYNETSMHLLGVARYYLVNKSYDEDVIIDAFLKVYRYIGSFDSAQNGYNWLCKIVQNVALSYNTDQSRAAQAELKYTLANREAVVENDFNAVDFFMIISDLPEPDHTIALMRYYLGFTFDEIGKKYNVSRVAIHSRIKRICKYIEKKYYKKGKQK